MISGIIKSNSIIINCFAQHFKYDSLLYAISSHFVRISEMPCQFSYLFAFVLSLPGCRWNKEKIKKAWGVRIQVPDNFISLVKVGIKRLLNNLNSTWNDNK
jgi:hypothetical protein